MMPIISTFQGILIRMNPSEHNPPHFHAIYQEQEAQFDFEGNIIKGSLPAKKAKLVTAWAILHTEDLQVNWNLLMNKEPVFKIDPLR